MMDKFQIFHCSNPECRAELDEATATIHWWDDKPFCEYCSNDTAATIYAELKNRGNGVDY